MVEVGPESSGLKHMLQESSLNRATNIFSGCEEELCHRTRGSGQNCCCVCHFRQVTEPQVKGPRCLVSALDFIVIDTLSNTLQEVSLDQAARHLPPKFGPNSIIALVRQAIELCDS